LAASGKPEHIDSIQFSEREINERLKKYRDIARKAENLKNHIPKRLQSAYFELILYPVLGAANINKKKYFTLKEEKPANQSGHTMK
jgi:hypothetical protein